MATHPITTTLTGPVRVALAPLAWLLAGVEAAVRRPSLVVAGTVLLVCLPSGIQDVSASGHITAADLGAFLSVLILGVRLLAGDRVATRRGWLPYAALIASLVLATVTAADTGESIRGFIRYTELFVIVPVAVAMAVKDKLDVLLIAGALVAVTAFEGAVGVYQYATQTGASYAGAYIRAIGTFGAEQIMALGALVGYGICVTLALALSLTGRWRVVLLGVTAALALPLGFSFSRGAWIATAAAVLLALVLYSWRITFALVGTAALAVAVFALAGTGAGSSSSSRSVDQRIASIFSSDSEPDRSVKDRYALWATAIDIWADHPVVGVGLKDFAQYRDTYAPLSLSSGSDVADPSQGFRREPLLSAHNQYLMVLSEQGAVGALAFGGLLGTLAVGAVRRRRPDDPPTPLPRFFDIAAPAVMVWTLIDFLYGDIGAGPTGVVLAILLGLVARRSVIIPAGSTR
jgi:O-antigen ligase